MAADKLCRRLNCFVSLRIFINCFSVICLESVSQRDRVYGRIISKKAKIRIGYGQSVPGGMSVSPQVSQNGVHKQSQAVQYSAR